MRKGKQVIDENTMFSDDYIIDGTSKLWPPMNFPYIPWLSPSKVKAFTRVAFPISLLFLFLTGPGGNYYGLSGTIVFLIISFFFLRRGSKWDWAVWLMGGLWVKYSDDATINKILNSTKFMVNRGTGRVYNKKETPFVKKYREEHPDWWRKDEGDPVIPYDDNLHCHYFKPESFSGPGRKMWVKYELWVTEEEYAKIEERAKEIDRYASGSYYFDKECKAKGMNPIETYKLYQSTWGHYFVRSYFDARAYAVQEFIETLGPDFDNVKSI